MSEDLRSTSPKGTRRRRVLVVDDSHDARTILQLCLTTLGHDVRTAEDGPQGVELTRDFRPEVVLCDINLVGGMSGYALAEAIRKDKALAEICLVAISGWDAVEHQERAFAAGFDEVLTKPVDLACLITILDVPPLRLTSRDQQERRGMD